ncbi:MAG: fused MFS/spermidine synthase [Silicimonas sp.]|nr:fused MFS/spermidine synthase [Silicimonas sp.]
MKRAAPVVFTATIFLSAALLFFVQPLFAKIVLPVIGGSPAVWTTAMLFFQTVLICGYLYAHFSARYLPVRFQAGVHIALWALALAFLPPDIPDGWRLDASGWIAAQTLGLFALGVGAPFALLSANAPLIQSWYARSDGPSADDPYFLYGASNLGSLLALLAFPLLAEPLLGAHEIASGFAGGFVLLGAGLLACVLMAGHAKSETAVDTSPAVAAPGPGEIGHWLVLAFLPSSLMLAVTSKISTDVGAVPLVWVVPLALYLLTFAMTFSGQTPFRGRWLRQVAQLAIVLGICIFMGVTGVYIGPLQAFLLIFAFFAVALWAHRTLYEIRPNAKYLTVFYVTMSVGGALGGFFNSILAPVLFSDLIEGTITLALALVLVFQPLLKLTRASLLRGLAAGTVAGLAATVVALYVAAESWWLLGLAGIGVALATLLCPRPFSSWLVAIGLTTVLPLWIAGPDDRLFHDRSFFGLHQVVDQDGTRLYSNGTTTHGAQPLADLGAARPQPTTYYHAAAPMGQIMASATGQSAQRVGIVGLGVGALACYAQPGQDWHFYEIDAMVDRVARDTSFFTFLAKCTPDAPTHLGDARVVLQDQPDLRFDILVIDAYSSDAVPVHLTTDDAMGLYLDRLAPEGLLVYHISNRYYDIGLPLARSAEARGLSIWRQQSPADASDDPGYRPSDVALIARDPAHAAEVLSSGLWTPLDSDGKVPWTDERANPLSILRGDVFR